ncbi:cysteine desulfurase IscS [Abditibacterium utsteinense]|uniref:cysteine desulfurase n=1 Tax=Abditibacterium utsteinense TaxID=1960156 RepID=A0A2S8SWX5_9BACT|nr:cysteine desulfurase family protein [Abditibacterium utsteinense]PQV65274.1 cysteine desulfurase IscS [Abditibacterium utsteinense]
MEPLIYLDAHATTPCDPRVVEAMLPYFFERFGNSSSPHAAGERTHQAVEDAREAVASLLGARADEVIWTSGATESNNLAIRGVAQSAMRGALFQKGLGERRKIAISAIEHKSVSEVVSSLRSDGFEIVVLPVDSGGRVQLERARDLIDAETLLVSVQAANGEIGTIQPLAELVALSHDQGALFHCDAAQAVGKIPIDVVSLGIDLLSLSAHKMYGPQGVGALFVRRALRSLLMPQQVGGGQERGVRAGTLNVPGIVGLGEASRLCKSEMEAEGVRLGAWRDQMEKTLQSVIPTLRLNGASDPRLPHNASLSFPGIEASLLLARLPNLAVSSGAACDSGAPEPSKTLQNIGLSRPDAASTIRIGLHRWNTLEEVKHAIKLLVDQVSGFDHIL